MILVNFKNSTCWHWTQPRCENRSVDSRSLVATLTLKFSVSSIFLNRVVFLLARIQEVGNTEKESNQRKNRAMETKRGEIKCNSLVFNESQAGVLMHCTFLVASALSRIPVGLVSKRCLRKDFPFCGSLALAEEVTLRGKRGPLTVTGADLAALKPAGMRSIPGAQHPSAEPGCGGQEKQLTVRSVSWVPWPGILAQRLACWNYPPDVSKAKRVPYKFAHFAPNTFGIKDEKNISSLKTKM